MPRGPGGVYDLYTPGNPVQSGTVIDTDWANPTLEDVGVALSDSLSRTGKGGMTAPLRGPDGSEAVPTFSFTSESDTGRYREGPGQVVETVQGSKVVRFRAGGMDQWNQSLNGGLGDWEPLTPRDAAGTPYDPSFSPLTSDNVQDAIDEVVGLTGGVPTADGVTYDDSAVYFPAATVQIALDRLGNDLAVVANDLGDVAGDLTIVEGDLALLEGVVLQNSTDILVNQNNIAINASNFSGFYSTEFIPLRNRMDDVEATNITQDGSIDFLYNEQLSQDTRITNNANDNARQDTEIGTNETDIISANSRIDTNITNISNNLNSIIYINDENIRQEGLISGNTSSILSNAGSISTNANNIQSNTNAIQSNDTDIAQNASDINAVYGVVLDNIADIDVLEGRYSGGILSIVSGGTGVNSKSGTGSVVGANGASVQNFTLSSTTFFSGSILSGITAVTASPGDNDTSIATTAFVARDFGNAAMSHVNNAGASYQAIRRVDTGDRWQITQWGKRTFAVDPGARASFAISYLNTDYNVAIAPYVAGVEGLNTAPGINARFTNGFDGVAPNYLCGYVAVGEVAYSAAFAAIPLTGDRYYNKVERTEHVQQIHGPWGDNPDVVILPPANTYWGDPLDPDEELTYDIDNLPLARVARVISAEELIGNILRGANLTQMVLQRAMLANLRGNAVPLADFNAALDVVIGANPYSEAQFLGVL